MFTKTKHMDGGFSSQPAAFYQVMLPSDVWSTVWPGANGVDNDDFTADDILSLISEPQPEPTPLATTPLASVPTVNANSCVHPAVALSQPVSQITQYAPSVPQPSRLARAPKSRKPPHMTKRELRAPVCEDVLRLPLREFKAALSKLSPADRVCARAARRCLQNRKASDDMRQRLKDKLQACDQAADERLDALLGAVRERAVAHFGDHPNMAAFLDHLASDMTVVLQSK